MLWDPFLYCINDSIQGNSETGNKVFVLPSKVAINRKRLVSDRISIKEKFFYSIKFSTDRGYATSLGMNIYLWKEDIEDGASVMTVEYRPVEYGKDYDVVNNPDKFQLYIDGKEVEE